MNRKHFKTYRVKQRMWESREDAATEWEEIFVSEASNGRLISSTHEGLKRLNTKKTKNLILKIGYRAKQRVLREEVMQRASRHL